uniref:Uncharacterized protein n=1 Tax=Glycine max TaxID=3847 RepID=C6SXK3_SOYBN|nr:unknown [Glycine max]|eukprot:NP_001346067.1 18.5 kDa class I heat shock protein [Glycine max]
MISHQLQLFYFFIQSHLLRYILPSISLTIEHRKSHNFSNNKDKHKRPTTICFCLTRDLNVLHISLLNLFLGNSDSENPIFHRSLHFIHFCILRQSEPPHELAAATLHAMPRVIPIFLLNVPLSAYLKNLIIFNLNLHFLLLQPWNISLEYVCFWGLLPIHTSAHECRIFPRKFRKGS